MKFQAAVLAFFAAVALAAPAPEQATKVRVYRNPTKTMNKRFYGQAFCDCLVDCENEAGGSGGEGGVGLAACEDGCYSYPTPTHGTCEDHNDP